MVNNLADSGKTAAAEKLDKGLLGSYRSVLGRQLIASSTATDLPNIFEVYKANGSLLPIQDPTTGKTVSMSLADAEQKGIE